LKKAYEKGANEYVVKVCNFVQFSSYLKEALSFWMTPLSGQLPQRPPLGFCGENFMFSVVGGE